MELPGTSCPAVVTVDCSRGRRAGKEKGRGSLRALSFFYRWCEGLLAARSSATRTARTAGRSRTGLEQFDVEDTRRVRREAVFRLGAVSDVRRDEELVLAAGLHQLQAFAEARDDGLERDIGRTCGLVVGGSVKLLAVHERTGVVDRDLVVRARTCTGTCLDN